MLVLNDPPIRAGFDRGAAMSDRDDADEEAQADKNIADAKVGSYTVQSSRPEG